jgi:hypothetical protein
VSAAGLWGGSSSDLETKLELQILMVPVQESVEPDPVRCFIQVWCRVEVVGFVDVWWVDLLFFLVGLRR